MDKSQLTTASEQHYLRTVLNAYVALPETPPRWHSADRQIVRELFRRGIPIDVIETAFVLGPARRLGRAPEKVVPPIGCIGYFLPVIEEVLVLPAPARYIDWSIPRLAARAGLTKKR